MNIRQALKMAVKSISSNKARSLLTMLGVIIGLAAVIVLVSYSQGKNLATKALYESQGKNILEVYAYSWNSPGTSARSCTTTARAWTRWRASLPTARSGGT